jgi:hypothetical protein
MKTKKILMLVSIAMTAIAITCFARAERWPVTQKPSTSIGQAEAIGDKAIEKKYSGFFCIGARFAMLGDKDQEWELSYTNQKGERKWVIVNTNKEVEVLDTMRDQ